MDAKKAQEESDAYLQQALMQKGLTRLSKAEKEKIMEVRRGDADQTGQGGNKLAQKRNTKIIMGLERLPCEEWLQRLGLSS